MELKVSLYAFLLIMIFKFHNIKAYNSISNDYLDEIIKHPKSDDNIINGNNNKYRVQINGKDVIQYPKNVKNTENQNDYLDDIIKHPKSDDNIIIGNNNKNRVQVNGKTIIKYSKNVENTENQSWWGSIKSWFG